MQAARRLHARTRRAALLRAALRRRPWAHGGTLGLAYSGYTSGLSQPAAAHPLLAPQACLYALAAAVKTVDRLAGVPVGVAGGLHRAAQDSTSSGARTDVQPHPNQPILISNPTTPQVPAPPTPPTPHPPSPAPTHLLHQPPSRSTPHSPAPLSLAPTHQPPPASPGPPGPCPAPTPTPAQP